MNIKVEDRIPEMTNERIIEFWKTGLTVSQITKKYVRYSKQKGKRINLLDAQRYIEPIIFNYQTNLLKS